MLLVLSAPVFVIYMYFMAFRVSVPLDLVSDLVEDIILDMTAHPLDILDHLRLSFLLDIQLPLIDLGLLT